jgi:basic membrane lipoprotein Med (substrate-binding protein (PBP1-ABC) superfamily)
MSKTLRRLKRHPRTLIGTALAVIVIGVIALAARPHHRAAPPVYTPEVRTRVYSSFTACLLTGPSGIADTHTAPVWAGMQTASTQTRAQVSYLAVQGPQTASNAASYINALALRGCSVIVTSGTAPGQAANERASALARIIFITVGAPASKAANISTVTSGTAARVSHDVAALLTAAIGSHTTAP